MDPQSFQVVRVDAGYIGHDSRMCKKRSSVKVQGRGKASRSRAAIGVLPDENFWDRAEGDGMQRRGIEKVVTAQMQVAASCVFVVPGQPRYAASESVAAARAQRATELVLARANIGISPSRHQIFCVVIGTDTDVPERSERLKQARPLHKRRIAEAADDFETKRLLPLANAHCAEERQIRVFNPHVGKRRATGKSEVELHERVDVVSQRCLGRETSAPEVGAVLNCRNAGGLNR